MATCPTAALRAAMWAGVLRIALQAGPQGFPPRRTSLAKKDKKNLMMMLRSADGKCLIRQIQWIDDFIGRGLGLMGRRALAPGCGIALVPCRAIHTGLMRFRLDVFFFDRDCRVERCLFDLAPWRLAFGGARAWGVVEIASGWFPRDALKTGDKIVFQK